jgi:hypothetical protein
MTCGFAAVVLGTAAQFGLILVVAASSAGPRWIAESMFVGGVVADVATVLLGVVAVITGVVGLVQIGRSGRVKRGQGMAVTGIAIGSVLLILTAMIFGLALLGGM